MNRLDWQGNLGSSVRRGEIFEIDDPERITTWLEAGYVTNALEEDLEEEDLEEEEEEVGPDPGEEGEESEALEPSKMLGSAD